MIKSIEFYSDVPPGDSMKSASFLHREMDIIERFSASHPNNADTVCCNCCKSNNVHPFFVKWGVSFLRCTDCGSIFSNVSPASIQEYKNLKELVELRKSLEYQADIQSKRQVQWTEFNDWVFLRSFRFLGKKNGLNILDVGNRYIGLRSIIKDSDYCGHYSDIDSIITDSSLDDVDDNCFDVIILNDVLRQSSDPRDDLNKYVSKLAPGGILILTFRCGSGFDILTIKEHSQVFPYEHSLLPTEKGILSIFKDLDLDILEYSTPGLMDFRYVLDNKDHISDDNLFVKALVDISDVNIMADFQYFLQKSGMSSYVRLIARRDSSE